MFLLRSPELLVPCLAFLVALTQGCGHPATMVAMPETPAIASAHSKAVGTARFHSLSANGELGPAEQAGGSSIAVDATAAQSGDGTLGDRVFRLDAHGFLEGCRYVAFGRICNLATLPDGKTVLGGTLNWFIPKGTGDSPGSGGFLANGLVQHAAPTTDHAAAEERVVSNAPFNIGQWYHCRFTKLGPRCFPVSNDAGTSTMAGLAVATIRDGEARRDVIWLGLVEPAAVQTFLANPVLPMSFRELRRCEANDDSDGVTCRTVTMR